MSTLGLSALEKRRPRGHLWSLCSFLRRGSREGSADLFLPVSRLHGCGSGSKQHQGRFKLDNKEYLFTVRVVKHWNSLPIEVVGESSLAVFKTHLSNALIKSSPLLFCSLSLPLLFPLPPLLLFSLLSRKFKERQVSI